MKQERGQRVQGGAHLDTALDVLQLGTSFHCRMVIHQESV